MARRRTHRISLDPGEVQRLEGIVAEGGKNRTILTRCRILLSADESGGDGVDLSRTELARLAEVSPSTVTTTLKRYLNGGLDEVLTIKRSAKSDSSRLKVTENIKRQILRITSSPPPAGHSRWSLGLISEELEQSCGVLLSRSTVSRVQKFI